MSVYARRIGRMLHPRTQAVAISSGASGVMKQPASPTTLVDRARARNMAIVVLASAVASRHACAYQKVDLLPFGAPRPDLNVARLSTSEPFETDFFVSKR